MRELTRQLCGVVCVLACGESAARAWAQLASSMLTLRDGVPPPAMLVRDVTADGVELVAGESDGAAMQLLTWDRVASVQGNWRDKAAPYRAMSNDLWRARVRLERGDSLGAEPLLEKHAATFAQRQGPLSAMVWSGLLRCRVNRQAQSAAIVAWAGVVRAGQGEVVFASRAKAGDEARDTAIIDAGTMLAPQLAPIFLPAPSLQIVTQAIPAKSETRADKLMLLYVAAADFELGRKTPLPARESDDVALALTWDVVAARIGDDATKATAKKNLQARLQAAEPPRWQEAWVRVALGRLMIASTEVEERRLGVVMLLHVPARLADAHPYLAGLALAEVSVMLARDGDVTAARNTLAKLESDFPGHPALAWDGLRAVRNAEVKKTASADSQGGAR